MTLACALCVGALDELQYTDFSVKRYAGELTEPLISMLFGLLLFEMLNLERKEIV